MPHPGNYPSNSHSNSRHPTRNQEHTPLRGGRNMIAPNYHSTAGSTRSNGAENEGPPQYTQSDNTVPTYSTGLPYVATSFAVPSGPQSQPTRVGAAQPYEAFKGRGATKITVYVFIFLLGALISWVLQDMRAMSILNPSAIERRRLGWDREYAKHQIQVDLLTNATVKWTQEIERHESARHNMQAEREEWKKERAAWLAESLEREKLQQAAEKIVLEKEQRELERQKDEETRKTAGIRWQDPQSAQCLRFGVRRYTAKLENVPEGYNKLKACHETVAWIKGRALYPSECRDQGSWGGIEGTWIIDQDEAGCHTFWQEFKDKGCTASGSGIRRIESQLENLQGGDDGTTMCSSTPADFHDLHFEGPHSCVYWGKYGFWGLWFIDDESCRTGGGSARIELSLPADSEFPIPSK